MDFSCVFFFNDTATTEIYTLSLHDALPILGDAPALLLGIEDPKSGAHSPNESMHEGDLQKLTASIAHLFDNLANLPGDRKSTRLNSSHSQISYAVFCLKKRTMRSHDDASHF